MTEPSPVLSTKLTPSMSITSRGLPSLTASLTASFSAGAPVTSRRPDGASTVTPLSVCLLCTSRAIAKTIEVDLCPPPDLPPKGEGIYEVDLCPPPDLPPKGEGIYEVDLCPPPDLPPKGEGMHNE